MNLRLAFLVLAFSVLSGCATLPPGSGAPKSVSVAIADPQTTFEDLRQRNVRVRILTNSLESSTVLAAQAGYMRYRTPLLESGVELYEVRSLLGDARGSGESAAMSPTRRAASTWPESFQRESIRSSPFSARFTSSQPAAGQ